MTRKSPLMTRIREMNEGDVLTVRVEDYPTSTVRNYSTQISFILRRKYTVSLDRLRRVSTITRIS